MGEHIQKVDLTNILGEQKITTAANKQFTFNSATKVFFISGSTFNGNFNKLYSLQLLCFDLKILSTLSIITIH